MCGQEPNHSAFLVMFPPAGYPHSCPHVGRVGQGGHWQPLRRNSSGKKDWQLAFPAYGQKCSVIFDSVRWIQRTAASLPGEPKTKLPLGLCHLEEKNTCSALPLPMCRDSPTAWRPLCTAVPLLKQTHPWRQQFSSQMMIVEEQKAHPRRLKCTRRVQKNFQAQKRGARGALFLPSAAPNVRAGEVCQGTSWPSLSHAGRFWAAGSPQPVIPAARYVPVLSHSQIQGVKR